MSDKNKPFVKFQLSEGRDICVNISQIQYYIVNVKTKTIKLSLSSGSMDSVTITPRDYDGALQYFESMTVIPEFDKEIEVKKPKVKPKPKPEVKKPNLKIETPEEVIDRWNGNLKEIKETKIKELNDVSKIKQSSSGLGKKQNPRGKTKRRHVGRSKSKTKRS